jgi:hypothetical protein
MKKLLFVLSVFIACVLISQAQAISNIIITPNSFTVPTSQQVASYNATTGITTFRDVSGSSISTDNVIYPYLTGIGNYTTPNNQTTSSNNVGILGTTGGSTTQQSGATGNVYVQKLTGLTPGSSFNTVSLNIQTTAGYVRVKVYQDNGAGGGPYTLLANSTTLQVGGTGWQNFTLTAPGTVPASGNVWIGFEGNSGTTAYYKDTTTTQDYVTHTYGSGPSPFGTISSQTLGWNMRLSNSGSSSAVDNNLSTRWISNSETHPWIYVDIGSNVTPAALALYWDAKNSTATQLAIQASTDHSTWNTLRTVNTNLLVNATWNYIRWDVDKTQDRYVRIYDTNSSANVLSIWEIKVLEVTDSQLLYRHAHKAISTSDGTLALTS